MSIKSRILSLLSDGQAHSPEELIPITHRFSATINALREDGYQIDTVRITHNRYVYQMQAKPNQNRKIA